MKNIRRLCRHCLPAWKRSSRVCRSGNVIVLSAFLIVMIMGFAAFTIDLGYIAISRGQLQAAVDAATLSAAMELNPNVDQAVVEANVKASAAELAGLNPVGPWQGLLLDTDLDVELGRRDWDFTNKVWKVDFGPEAIPYNIVRVTGRLDEVWTGAEFEDRRLPMFFAPVIGSEKVDMATTSVGTYQPRDMMLVLDYSGSMNDDTEFKSIPDLGQQEITDAITTMWHELSDPAYGSMPFTPQFLTVSGVPADTGLAIPHVSVTYKGTSATVTSTLPMTNIRLKFTNGSTVNINPLSATSGTYSGSGSLSNTRISRVWVEAGSNAGLSSEGAGERFPFDNTDIVSHLGLAQTSYPYPSGSWSDFINYVNTSSNVNTAGFRWKYSIMCLINYWNESKPLHANTPDLWKVTTQPLSAAKNASDTLIDYISTVEADDRLGLSIYTHTSSAGAILESGLTLDIQAVKPLYRNRQAGHYDNMTNIGAGIKVARLELEANARPQAFRMIVLMTDGVANRPTSNPEAYALQQAQLCKDAQIRIMTISLGLGADTSLMQQIADTTGGSHFNVPGGGTIAEYEAQLMDVFQKIAADRPLKLLPSFKQAN